MAKVTVTIKGLPPRTRERGSIPPCPYCGKSNSTIVNARCSGWMQGTFDENGENIEYCNDGLISSLTKTVRCDTCLKIRRDLTVIDGRVVQKHG